MADNDFSPTSPISSRTYRAEDDTTGGGGRALARVVSPFVAVIPWLMTVGGVWALARAQQALTMRFEADWGWLLGGFALFVLAALVWAALTAWSSVGTVLAGLCSLLFGLALAVPEISAEIFQQLPREPGPEFWYVVTPANFQLIGSLLLAVGLGAAGARRLRR